MLNNKKTEILYEYYLDENSKINFKNSKELIVLDTDFVSVFYTSDDECDTLIKHGNKDIVNSYYSHYKQVFEVNPITSKLGTLEYMEVPIKFLDLLNNCIKTSATKKLSDLKRRIENTDLNIIDVEVL